MKSGRINKRFALLAILCVLAMVFAVPVASAAGYSKVYGQTQDKIRVRESASTNATIIDNIVKDACVYITSSKVSGSNTFVQVKYRASDGSTETGWVCQNDGKDTYVKILSAEQAKSKFKVSGGDVPSKAVGTFTAAERKASAANSDNTYIRQNASGETVKRIQTELKALNYYSGKITGNAGEKTVAAIKSFQRKNGLTADGIAGPATLKAMGIYSTSSGSGSAGGSSGSGQYTQSDYALLARLISAEARGEPYSGQVAVGAVVLNRVEHPSFPDTISGVIYQNGAFSCLNDGQFNQPVAESAYRAAQDALNGLDPAGGAIYYYNPKTATNKWIRSRPIIATIGRHVFCM